MFDAIAFDADDTLWHNESLYLHAQDQYMQLLAPYCDAAEIKQSSYQTEINNLQFRGYGFKGFTLSFTEVMHF